MAIILVKLLALIIILQYSSSHPLSALQKHRFSNPALHLSPQLYMNSGFPSDNPPKNLPGVSRVPSSTETPTSNEATTKETANKFDIGGVPVWDEIPGPSSNAAVRPTRRPKKPGQPATQPPLVHKESSLESGTVEKSAGRPMGNLRPNSGSSQRVPKPQEPPQPPKETPISSNQPSTCVWAIISCCAANSQHVSYSCFEQLGCTGAFWDQSPCESDFARSAIAAAMNYYNA